MNQLPTSKSSEASQKQGGKITALPQQDTNAYIFDMLQQLEGLANQAQLTDLAFMIHLAKNCSKQFELSQ